MKNKSIPSLVMCLTLLATLGVQSNFAVIAVSAEAAAAAAVKAAAAKAAADAKVKQLEEKRAAFDAFIKKHLAALNPQHPNLTASDVARLSETDLRSLYTQSYIKQGMSISAAHAKANALTDLKP